MRRMFLAAIATAAALTAGCGTSTNKAAPVETTADASSTTTAATTSTTVRAPLPDDPAVTFHVIGEMPPSVERSVRQATLAARAVLDEASPMTVYVTKIDVDGLARECAAAAGVSFEEARGYVLGGGISFPGFACISIPSSFMAGHEATHMVQYARLDTSNVNLMSEVPRWLSEGHADYVAHQADELRGRGKWVHSRDGVIFKATKAPLSDFENPVGIAFRESGRYEQGNLAVEFLESLSSPEAVNRDYWTATGRVGPRQAFEEVFHMTLEDFYARFEEHAAAGFPLPAN